MCHVLTEVSKSILCSIYSLYLWDALKPWKLHSHSFCLEAIKQIYLNAGTKSYWDTVCICPSSWRKQKVLTCEGLEYQSSNLSWANTQEICSLWNTEGRLKLVYLQGIGPFIQTQPAVLKWWCVVCLFTLIDSRALRTFLQMNDFSASQKPTYI